MRVMFDVDTAERICLLVTDVVDAPGAVQVVFAPGCMRLGN